MFFDNKKVFVLLHIGAWVSKLTFMLGVFFWNGNIWMRILVPCLKDKIVDAYFGAVRFGIVKIRPLSKNMDLFSSEARHHNK